MRECTARALRRSCKQSLHLLAQTPRFLCGVRRLIIVEVAIGVDALVVPCSDASCPFREAPIVVFALITAARTVQPDVTEIRGDLQRREKKIELVNAKRHRMSLQQCIDPVAYTPLRAPE